MNVHPTKHEVHFLHEDKIVEAVQRAIESSLLGCNASRTYFTQALLPGAAVPVETELLGDGREKRETEKQQASTYAYQMVRTDSKEQKLDAFFAPKSLKVKQLPQSAELMEGAASGSVEEREKEVEVMWEEGSSSRRSFGGKKRAGPVLEQPFKRKSRRKEVKLTSVKSLQQAVRTSMHKGESIHTVRPRSVQQCVIYYYRTYSYIDLTELFQNHIFVGCVDQTRALVQHQTKLYLVDVTRIT